MAVDDRSGGMHLGGKPAIGRLRSIFRNILNGDLEVQYSASSADVDRALESWSLTKFKFTVRPNNPRPVSRLAEELSAQMKRDGIGVLSGQALPIDGEHIRVGTEGIIRPTADLVEAGYGQMSFAGELPNGQFAEVKKPKFDRSRVRNLEIQKKEREMRIYIEDSSEKDSVILRDAAASMMEFYGYGRAAS